MVWVSMVCDFYGTTFAYTTTLMALYHNVKQIKHTQTAALWGEDAVPKRTVGLGDDAPQLPIHLSGIEG